MTWSTCAVDRGAHRPASIAMPTAKSANAPPSFASAPCSAGGAREGAAELAQLDRQQRRARARAGDRDERVDRGRGQLVEDHAVAVAGHRVLRVHVDVAQRGGRDRREHVDLGLERAQRRRARSAPRRPRRRGRRRRSPTNWRPRTGSGMSGSGGTCSRRADVEIASGAVRHHSTYALEDLGRPLPRPEHRAGVDLGRGVEDELHRGHDAEAAAAAAQRPEQLGLVVAVGAHDAAVGGDELDREHAVGGEAVAARRASSGRRRACSRRRRRPARSRRAARGRARTPGR